VSESGTTQSFTVVLDAQPSSNVVLNITSGDTGEATVDKSTVTFTNSNWSTPQSVTITGVDDSEVDGSQNFNISISVDDANSDDVYDPLSDKTVAVTTTDDDRESTDDDQNPPVIETTLNNITMSEDNGTTNYELNVSDIDLENLTLSVESNNSNLISVGQKWENPISSSEYENLEFNLTTVANESGIAKITVKLSDGEANVTQSFNVSVNAVNDVPVIETSYTDITLEENNGTTSYEVNVNDIDSHELNITVESNNTNILTVTPNWSGALESSEWHQAFNLSTVENAHGLVMISITVNDGEATVSQSFEVRVNAVNDEEELEEPESSQSIVVPYEENGDDVNTSVLFDESLEDVEIDENEATVNIGSNSIHLSVASNGIANASISFEDGSVSEVQVNNTRSQTIVDANGNVEITLNLNDETSIETRLNADGTVTHKVSYRGEVTEATSNIPGASVTIDENGNVETKSEVEKNGFKYIAIVTTDTQGETTTKFMRINVATGEEEDLSHTLEAGSSFERGNNPEVIEINDLIYIKVTTSLDNGALVIE
jgi:uncharacterized membrane protein YkoI